MRNANMTRRAMIGGAAMSLLVRPATAAPGAAVSPEILSQARSMRAIRTGSGRGSIFILFSTSCQFSRGLYQGSFAFGNAAAFYWIPVADGTPGGDSGAVALANADANLLHAIMAGGLRVPDAPEHRALAARSRDQIHATIGNAIARSTGRPLGTPTLVYRDRDGVTRLIRGGPSAAVLREICDSAA